MDIKSKKEKKDRRHRRIRAKAFGTSLKPRFCVFRSNAHTYGQLIDDDKGKTLASVSDIAIKKPGKAAGKVGIAREVGKLIAQKAGALKIEKVVFDRGGYKYHGRVKALAEGAREGGLKF